jgi:nucleotide-binding universal stress UspA family protein
MRSGAGAVARASGSLGVTRLVVIERPGASLPGWVPRRRAGAALSVARHATLPPASAVWSPGAAEAWAQVVVDVARTTATGAAVLLNLPTSRATSTPRVIAAVQSAHDDLGVCVEAARCAAALAADVVLLHCVPVSFAERSVGLAAAVDRGGAVLRDSQRGLAGELATLHPRQGHDVPVSTRLVRAYPHELVSDDLDADLMVVGGSRLGTAAGLGLVALSVVRHAPCPVLVVPRPSVDDAAPS